MRNEEILDSWKAISDYLGRDIRTCARWEKELGLPIFRIDQDSPRSKVFAYKSEIEEWLKERANHNGISQKPLKGKKWVIVGLVSVVVLLISVSASLYITNGKSSSANTENLSIAVLPYESSNFTEYEEYIPQGISNNIFDSLSRLNNIRAIPSTLLARDNNPSKSLKNIGEEHNVNHVLKTKLKKNEDKMSIQVQLIRIKDEKTLWKVESERKLEEFFSLQGDICLKIHKKLNSNNKIMDAMAFNKGQTEDYAALDRVLRGNHILSKANSGNNDTWTLYNQGNYYQKQWGKESNNLAINFFCQAIEIDENFAPAYIGLARCYANYVNFYWDYNEGWLDKAEDLLKIAQTINPECPQYYSTLIQLYLVKYIGFDDDTKDKAFLIAQEAIEKFPNHPHLYAQVGYCYRLQFGESGDSSDFKKALELNNENYLTNPFHVNNIVFAELLMLNKEFDRALLICDDIQGNESSLMAEFRKGEIYYYMGELDKSEFVFSQFDHKFDYKVASLFHLGMIAAQRGDTDEARRIIQKIDFRAPHEFKFFEDKLKLASIYMGIGEKELGYQTLEDFFAQENTNKTRYIYHKFIEIDKNFDNFREEERFQNIINNMGGGISND